MTTADIFDREWNPRYVAYAASYGRTPEAQMEVDRIEWPGGRLAGFLTWNSEQLLIWAEETGQRKACGDSWSVTQLAEYDAWLAATYPLPAEERCACGHRELSDGYGGHECPNCGTIMQVAKRCDVGGGANYVVAEYGPPKQSPRRRRR